METQIITQNEVLQSDNSLLNLKHVLVTEVELNNGKKTKMVTFFNYTEIDHEEVNFGIQKALEGSRNVSKMKSTLCSIKTGILKPFMFFVETKIYPRNAF